MSDATGRKEVHPDFAKYLAGDIPMNREDAASMLRYVGMNVGSGYYPDEIPPYLLGQAVGRYIYNFITKCVETDGRMSVEQDDDTITREFIAGLLGLKL